MNPDVPDRSRWRVEDIVYVAIVSPIMVCAMVEWFLWLAAFLYCLGKAFKKADHWSTRLLVVLMTLLFTILRLVLMMRSEYC